MRRAEEPDHRGAGGAAAVALLRGVNKELKASKYSEVAAAGNRPRLQAPGRARPPGAGPSHSAGHRLPESQRLSEPGVWTRLGAQRRGQGREPTVPGAPATRPHRGAGGASSPRSRCGGAGEQRVSHLEHF